jgi:hypothetical protein
MDVETQVIYIDTAVAWHCDTVEGRLAGLAAFAFHGDRLQVENATRPTPDIKSLAALMLESDGERFKGQQLIFRHDSA